jgi:hypothetical protein
MGARYYDPASGRFLTPDPMGHEGSLSLYDYAGGDPVNGIDPDGRLGTQFGLPSNAQLSSQLSHPEYYEAGYWEWQEMNRKANEEAGECYSHCPGSTSFGRWTRR